MIARTRTQLALLAWVLVACGFVWAAPEPPPSPAAPPDDVTVRQRSADLAARDARLRTELVGDLHRPWAQSEGHLAIVIDDVGRELQLFEQLIALRYPLTFAVLPRSPYASGVQLRLAADPRRRREVMLHLPMEPLDESATHRGAETREVFLRAGDPPDALRAKLEEALARVPSAVGVNNHMGSRLTADEAAMEALMPVLRERGLYFLDSRTTAETVAATVAGDAAVPALSRQVFLDHDPHPDSVRAALREAAERSRSAPVVAIGHPTPATVAVLREELPRLYASGVTVYSLSELVRRRSGGQDGPGPENVH